jgi:hypothetical protein
MPTNEPIEHVCEDCDGYADEERPCPYNEGMGGLTHMVWLCDRCYKQREYEL